MAGSAVREVSQRVRQIITFELLGVKCGGAGNTPLAFVVPLEGGKAPRRCN